MKEVLDFFQNRYSLLAIYRQPGDELQILQGINSDYYKAARLVRSFSTPGLRKVINAILQKEELELLGSILKAIVEGQDPTTIHTQLFPVGEYDDERIKRLAGMRSVRRAVEFIEDKELAESILAAMNEPGVNTVAALDLSIQAAYAQRLWRTVKVFLTGLHAEGAKRIIGQWLDLQNILAIARSRKLGLPSKFVQSNLLPVHYRLQASTIQDMASSASLTDIVRNVSATSYQKALGDYERVRGPGDEVSLLETSFHRYLARQCFGSFGGWRFSAGLAVAFLYLKLFETMDLRAILTAKAKSLPPPLIWNDIVLHPPPSSR